MILPFRKKLLSEQETVRQVEKKIGKQIYTGPFAGLKIPDLVSGKLNLYEILGVYESAIRPFIGDLINQNPKDIMIIGGNRGYYAAGFSYLFKPDNLYVYEMDEKFHPAIKSWVEPNDLKDFQIYLKADEDSMKNWDKPVDLVLADCEGAEFDLLDPEKYNWQKGVHLIVEIHYFYNSKITGTLIERFQKTHHIEIVYDDLSENHLIDNFLKESGIPGFYPRQPWHRWIRSEKGNRTLTNGVFMYLKPKA